MGSHRFDEKGLAAGRLTCTKDEAVAVGGSC